MKRRGQSTLEYITLLAFIVAAVIGIQVYAKRAMAGRLKEYSEQLTDGTYSPRLTTARTVVTTDTYEETIGEGDTNTSKASFSQDTQKTEDVGQLRDEPAR